MLITCESQASPEQTNWGDNSDRTMEVGKQYTLERVEVCSWHTKLYFTEYPNESFNSVNYSTEWETICDAHGNKQGIYYPDGTFINRYGNYRYAN